MADIFSSASIAFLILFALPGFISVSIALSLGVVEQTVSRTQILFTSVLSSTLIYTPLLSSYQYSVENPVQGPEIILAVFFVPTFQPMWVILMLSLSVLLGFIYAFVLAYDLPEFIRENIIWANRSTRRHPRQPWEGALESAELVQVLTTDDIIIRGKVTEYSRAEKDKELTIGDPHFWDPVNGGWKNHETKAIILFGDNIVDIQIRK